MEAYRKKLGDIGDMEKDILYVCLYLLISPYVFLLSPTSSIYP